MGRGAVTLRVVLNPVGLLRHLLVGAAVLAPPALVAGGVVGGGIHDERFDAKQVLVTPMGDGVSIREVVDQDFGTSDRHGYERVVPNDFGVPTEVSASSPDAPDQVSVTTYTFETRIRIGDPDKTISGQHRYVLQYVLPEAHLGEGELALDIIGTDETMETKRFEVVLAGFDLSDPRCNVGSLGDSGGCRLTREGDLYRVVFEPLKVGEGVTIGGHIVGTSTPAIPPLPSLPDRREENRLPLTIGTGALGLATALAGFRVARRLGRNVVADGGAADAAFGADTGLPTRLVADGDMEDLATTEFVPPPKMEPWEGAMLLEEKIDNDTTAAWFAGQIANEVINLSAAEPPVLSAGPRLESADHATRQRVRSLLNDGSGELVLDQFQPKLAQAWRSVQKMQVKSAKSSGWWKRFPPGTPAQYPKVLALTLVGAVLLVGLGWWAGLMKAMPMALVLAVALPGVIAGVAYRPLLPVRSVGGSALVLRVASFRRFLEASEGQHVDWAWRHGLLREYTAWAVALGAAEAWGRALAGSTVPPPEMAQLSAPLLMHTRRSALQTAHHAPSTSSGSGSSGSFGGGFSSGGVGGGGGGGHSGSW